MDVMSGQLGDGVICQLAWLFVVGGYKMQGVFHQGQGRERRMVFLARADLYLACPGIAAEGRREPDAMGCRMIPCSQDGCGRPGCRCPMWRGERASLPACCSTGVDECWKAACKRSRLTKMSSARAVSVSWNDGCANWSACSAARPWKPRFSRKRSTSRG